MIGTPGNCNGKKLALLALVAPALVYGAPLDSILKPDLVIADVRVFPAHPDRLLVRVANQGLAPAVETRIELLYRRGSKATPMSAAVPFLKAGERHWLVFEVGASVDDADTLTLRIDEPSMVIESDESNNAYRFR